MSNKDRQNEQQRIADPKQKPALVKQIIEKVVEKVQKK